MQVRIRRQWRRLSRCWLHRSLVFLQGFTYDKPASLSSFDILEGGFGDDAASFFRCEGAARKDAWWVHFVEADVEGDGACHQEVVVVSGDGSVCSVGFALVLKVFVETLRVAFGVEAVADGFDECGDDHRFGGDVGVEAVFAWQSLADFVFGLSARVEVWVYSGDLVEDVLRLVAPFNLAFAVVGFESVAFDHEQ